MSNSEDFVTKPTYQSLRIWPAVLMLLGMIAAHYSPLSSKDETMVLLVISILGPLVLCLGILIWWMAGSRAKRSEKVMGVLGVVILATLTIVFLDKTMIGPGIIILAFPIGIAAFAVGAIICRNVCSPKRLLTMLLLSALGFGFSTALRSDGMWGNGALDLHWRWQNSAEDNLLANQPATENVTPDSSEADLEQWFANPEWPRFRGINGNNRYLGPKLETNWSANPPKELWRISVGPGWSSFVVAGNLLYTQEQRGESEAVVCYEADSGKQIWLEQIESRFFDPLGGLGPRATPTISRGALFALGANGHLQRFDPVSGNVIWRKDIRKVADREPPKWGFSSSPLVVGDTVIVHAGGKDDNGTLAFDTETGDLKWSVPAGDHSYSSPELTSIDGKDFVLMLTNAGLDVIEPQTGTVALAYSWKHNGYRATQPQVLENGSVIFGTQALGTRRIELSFSNETLEAKEVWTSRFLKPDFNDFVVHQGHAYGFDGSIFTSVDMETGKRNWKQGRYGKGQVFLLADSDTLLVMSEEGKVVLLKANPAKHEAISSFPVFDARTWNHPIVVGGRLYVRNSEEAACFQLQFISDDTESAATE